MKVLLINGSPRKQGNTFTALSEVAKTLEKNGIEAEIVQMGMKPVRGCIACGQCKAKGNNKCVFDDDVCNRIRRRWQRQTPWWWVHLYITGNPTVRYCH